MLVLGTLITEWDDGAQRCSEFLEDEHSYKAFANQLVDITEYYHFDGWLINIENPIQVCTIIVTILVYRIIIMNLSLLVCEGSKLF